MLRPKLGKSAAKLVEANADVQTASTAPEYLDALEKVFQPRELECSQALSSLDAAGSTSQTTGKLITAVEFVKKMKKSSRNTTANFQTATLRLRFGVYPFLIRHAPAYYHTAPPGCRSECYCDHK